MKSLKLRFLVDLVTLIKNLKIFLKIKKDSDILVYYNDNCLLTNSDLFKSILHYNRIKLNNDNKMEIKLNIRLNDKYQIILVTFLNKLIEENEYIKL